MEEVRREILKTCDVEIKKFVKELEHAYMRKIRTVTILPLHGKPTEVVDVEQAIDFINGYETIPEDHQLEYIEVIVNYNNGTDIKCRFREKDEAVEFLGKIK